MARVVLGSWLTAMRPPAQVRVGEKLRPAMRAVMLDFLIRHGRVTADSEPALIEILAALHCPRLGARGGGWNQC